MNCAFPCGDFPWAEQEPPELVVGEMLGLEEGDTDGDPEGEREGLALGLVSPPTGGNAEEIGIQSSAPPVSREEAAMAMPERYRASGDQAKGPYRPPRPGVRFRIWSERK